MVYICVEIFLQLNKIAPIIVFTLLFCQLNFSQESSSKQSLSFSNHSIEFTSEVSVKLDDVFEFVSGRTLELKSDNKEVDGKMESFSNHLMYKSKLIKRLYKKIAHLNESTC